MTGIDPTRPGTTRRVRRRWGRTAVVTGVVVAAAGVATAAALGGFGGGPGTAPAASNLPPATAPVTRTTLVATTDLEGTLGYGETTTVSVTGAGPEGAGGVITWRPTAGETLARGETVYAVDAEPVVLLYGSTPFYRPVGAGDTGPDVAQLERNLSELDYAGFTVDDEFTAATAEAVAAWQEDLGLPATGRLDPARAVVAPGAVRVAELLAPLGGPASGEVLTYTGRDRQVTVELDVADQQLVAEDLPVTVTLPDGSPVEATVTEVGTVATGTDQDAAGGQPAEAGPTTVEVTIAVDDPDGLGDWQAGPVDVTVETGRREDVLAVPVGALVALSEGGYGVQVVEDGQTRYLPVTTGLFADGLVEVDGAGIAAGMVVGVPA